MDLKKGDIVKIIKLLNLTTSSNDSEALAASRKANSLLKARNILWDSLIDSTCMEKKQQTYKEYEEYTEEGEYDEYEEPRKTVRANAEINHMFFILKQRISYGVLSGRAADFIKSLDSYYTKWERLTAKQYEALRKFYRNG